MAARYTNITSCTHKAIAISNVISVSFTESIEHLLSQADGERGEEVVGDLSHAIEVTIEAEDVAEDIGARLGFAGAGDLIFKVQLDSDPAIVKTYTITNVVLRDWNPTTNQDGVNTISISGRTTTQDSTVTIA